MTCEYRDGETVTKRVTRQHWHDGKLYIVENVPAEVCIECGERYYQAAVLKEIDRMLKSDYEVKEKMIVEVVSL